MKKDYKCKGCSKDFNPKTKQQIFCCPPCREKFYEEKNQQDYLERRNKLYLIFKRDDFKCIYCGSSAHDGNELTIDHIYPISKGGGNDLFNLASCCTPCNSSKMSNTLSKEKILELWDRNKKKDLKSKLTESYQELLLEFNKIYR